MSVTKIEVRRQRIGRICLATGLVAVVWTLTPGINFRGDPHASAETIAAGEALFTHEWAPGDELAGGDGLGPVFNARSCAACHHQGGVGGGGDFRSNVTTFRTRPSREEPNGRGGLVHKFAVDPADTESNGLMRRLYPVSFTEREVRYECNGQVNIQLIRTTFDPLKVGSINTPALFGIGWIERIPDKTIVSRAHLETMKQIVRELGGDFEGQTIGRVRYLAGGRVGKFGWKAQFATVEDFVAAACANELGLGTPRTKQAKPVGRPDFPDAAPDLDKRQLRELTAFVDTLPKPVEVAADPVAAERAAQGKELFHQVGCAVCHPEKVGALVGVYGDFLLHEIEDPDVGSGASGYGDLPPAKDEGSSGEPLPHEWKTPPLWGVADSAPYFHDGGSKTLESAILRHAGTARPMVERYRDLRRSERESIIEFLRTLRAPPPKPAPDATRTLVSL